MIATAAISGVLKSGKVVATSAGKGISPATAEHSKYVLLQLSRGGVLKVPSLSLRYGGASALVGIDCQWNNR